MLALQRLQKLGALVSTNMASVISLGITFLLALQVCGRPSLYYENRLNDDVAYRGAGVYSKPGLLDARKDDDSELERNPWKHYPENGRAREKDVRNVNLGVFEKNARDDSMLNEQKVPSALNRYENNYARRGEARGLDSNENDDSSLEARHELPFKNQKGAVDSHRSGNDDSLEEYEPWVNRHGKGHVTTDDVLQGEAREERKNSNDDSAASEEENMAKAALASKFSGRGKDANESLDNRVDIFHKRYYTRSHCRYCCLSSRCATANRFCSRWC